MYGLILQAKRFRDSYNAYWQQKDAEIRRTFLKAGVDASFISTTDNYVQALIRLFHERALRH